MTDPRPVYVLDTGPLSHFASCQWLGVLKMVLNDGRCVIPDVVAHELREGQARHPHLQYALDCTWIEEVSVSTPEQLTAFSYYQKRLVGRDARNVGECGVLALAETMPNGLAVIDDRVAVTAAKSRSVKVRRTLALLCEAIRMGQLTVPLVSALADDLLANEYRLPFGPGGFARWAHEQGLS